MRKLEIFTGDYEEDERPSSLDFLFGNDDSGGDNERIIEALKEMMSVFIATEYDDSNFPEEEMAKEFAQICSGLTEYAHENDIRSIMLIDRSARPAYLGIREAWSRKYPEEARPDIYFINPTGFLDIRSGLKFNREYKTLQGLLLMMDSKNKENKTGNFFTQSRTKPAIDADFLTTYTKLASQKSEPLLLVDTCIHSGDSVRPLMKSLDRMGYTDVRLALASNTDNQSEIEPDVVLIDGDPLCYCYPFSKDTMTERTFGSVVSEKTTDREKALSAIALRKEVSQMFREAPDEWFK